MRRAAVGGRGRPRAAHGFASLIAVMLAAPGAYAQREIPQSPPSEDSVAALEAPLFASHETLHLRIEAPFRRLTGDRRQDAEEHPGALRVVAPASAVVALPVDIRTRGIFRLRRQTCVFPPLRLDFPKDSTLGTVFHGENHLKVVTHCRDNDRFEQYTLQEYLIYRIYNLLTDYSFRVRLARITYVDSERADSVTRYAFLIEDEDRMAARNGMVIVKMQGVSQEATKPEAITRTSLFQYLIGNTDWSVSALHNIKIIADEWQIPIAVPYDFDWSGVISSPYAEPHPDLGTRHVRERVFISGCRTAHELAPHLTVFNDVRPTIEEMVRTQDGIEPDTIEDMLEYLSEFYGIINDPRRVERELVRRRCPG